MSLHSNKAKLNKEEQRRFEKIESLFHERLSGTMEKDASFIKSVMNRLNEDGCSDELKLQVTLLSAEIAAEKGKDHSGEVDIESLVTQMMNAYRKQDFITLGRLIQLGEATAMKMDAAYPNDPTQPHWVSRHYLVKRITEQFGKKDWAAMTGMKIQIREYSWHLQEFFELAYRGYQAVGNPEAAIKYCEVCRTSSPYDARYQIDALLMGQDRKSEAYFSFVSFLMRRCCYRLDDLCNAFYLYGDGAAALGHFQEELDCCQAVYYLLKGDESAQLKARKWINECFQKHPELREGDYSEAAVRARNEDYGHPMVFDEEMISFFESLLQEELKDGFGPHTLDIAQSLYEMTKKDEYLDLIEKATSAPR